MEKLKKHLKPDSVNIWDIYVSRNEQDKATGFHFNLPGHSTSDMKVMVVEKIHQTDAFYRKEREHHHIKNFDLVRKGLNGKR